ncbi:MAG: outer membrane protein assembly factor BamD [Bacteroides sp.]|nr:outer membrane protein assembly factor BamD [Bacteroides sp.]
MKKYLIVMLLAAVVLSSCGEYNKLLKSTDYEYKYEAAKSYFAKGKYNKAATLLNELITILKGTDKAEESLYMLGMCYYNQKDYPTASQSFMTYYNTYPRGTYTELARFHSGKALYMDSPEARLDQSGTYMAIQELQMFMEYFPQSSKKQEAQDMIFNLQDKLVLKDYLAARLYYNLGTYLGNNYQSCVITAQNALKDYPYTKMREDLSILILRARYEMAINSIEERRDERYRETIDEYYGFRNEFPDSKFMREATRIFNASIKEVNPEEETLD